MLDAKLWSHIQNGGGVSDARGDSQSSIQMRNMWQTARIRKGTVRSSINTYVKANTLYIQSNGFIA